MSTPAPIGEGMLDEQARKWRKHCLDSREEFADWWLAETLRFLEAAARGLPRREVTDDDVRWLEQHVTRLVAREKSYAEGGAQFDRDRWEAHDEAATAVRLLEAVDHYRRYIAAAPAAAPDNIRLLLAERDGWKDYSDFCTKRNDAIRAENARLRAALDDLRAQLTSAETSMREIAAARDVLADKLTRIAVCAPGHFAEEKRTARGLRND